MDTSSLPLPSSTPSLLSSPLDKWLLIHPLPLPIMPSIPLIVIEDLEIRWWPGRAYIALISSLLPNAWAVEGGDTGDS